MYGKMQETGLTEMFLSYASQLYGANILQFDFSHPQFLTHGWKWWHCSSRVPAGSEIRIWRAGIADDRDILV